VTVREKIIVIALPGIGDALMSTPMFRLLREAKPEAKIHALVMFPATRDLLRSNANIDHVHYFDFINTSKLEGLLYLFHLRQEGFDISINIYPQNRWQYNIFALLLGAGRKLGIRYKLRDWRNLSWLCTDTLGEDDSLHCVEENVRLLQLIGIDHELDEATLPQLEIHLKTEHEAFASAWLKERELDGKQPIIGVHAGTALFKNHIMRRWAPEKFAQLARKLKAELGATVVLFGGPDDVDANKIIMQLAGDSIIEVKTKSIMESVAIMKHVDVFVSNDSALMHIAGGLGLKTVAIFGPTNETYVHPWKTEYEIIHTGIECRPCFRYSTRPLMCFRKDPNEHYLCISAIEVDTVFQATKRYVAAE
jgi:heptosyltransferase II